MRQTRQRTAYVERAILLFLLALFVLVSPLKGVWATPLLPWYSPYVIWAAVIGLAIRLQGHATDEV